MEQALGRGVGWLMVALLLVGCFSAEETVPCPEPQERTAELGCRCPDGTFDVPGRDARCSGRIDKVEGARLGDPGRDILDIEVAELVDGTRRVLLLERTRTDVVLTTYDLVEDAEGSPTLTEAGVFRRALPEGAPVIPTIQPVLGVEALEVGGVDYAFTMDYNGGIYAADLRETQVAEFTEVTVTGVEGEPMPWEPDKLLLGAMSRRQASSERASLLFYTGYAPNGVLDPFPLEWRFGAISLSPPAAEGDPVIARHRTTRVDPELQTRLGILELEGVQIVSLEPVRGSVDAYLAVGAGGIIGVDTENCEGGLEACQTYGDIEPLLFDIAVSDAESPPLLDVLQASNPDYSEALALAEARAAVRFGGEARRSSDNYGMLYLGAGAVEGLVTAVGQVGFFGCVGDDGVPEDCPAGTNSEETIPVYEPPVFTTWSRSTTGLELRNTIVLEESLAIGVLDALEPERIGATTQDPLFLATSLVGEETSLEVLAVGDEVRRLGGRSAEVLGMLPIFLPSMTRVDNLIFYAAEDGLEVFTIGFDPEP